MNGRYLIPRRITQRWELFPGWGKTELLLCLAGAGASAALAGLSALVGLPIAISIRLAVLPLGASVLLGMPQPSGGTFYDLLLAQQTYVSRRHLYLYDIGRDDA